MQTFAKLKAPIMGRGKAKIAFTKGFHKIDPEVRVSLINQLMRQFRDEYDRAEREARIKAQHEDAANAEAIRPPQAATS
jgi:hypothetical protein